MSKTHVFMLATMIAGDLERQEGKIYALSADTAAAVFRLHKGREATMAEIQRLGVTRDPVPAARRGMTAEQHKKVRAKRAEKRAKAASRGKSG